MFINSVDVSSANGFHGFWLRMYIHAYIQTCTHTYGNYLKFWEILAPFSVMVVLTWVPKIPCNHPSAPFLADSEPSVEQLS